MAAELRRDDAPLGPSTDWLPALGAASRWLTPEMREAVAARAAEAAARAPDISFGAHAIRQSIADSGDAHRHLRMLAQRQGVTLAAPYLGEAVLAAVAAVPAAMRMTPGQYKPMLRAASCAVDLAPDEIFSRKGKGAYSAEMHAGFNRALPDIRERLRQSRLAHLGIIDSEAVLASLSQARPPLASVRQLLASEHWLAHLGIDAPEGQQKAVRRAPKPHQEMTDLPEVAYAVRPSLHIVSGPGGQIAAFDPERGVFLPPIGKNPTTRTIFQTVVETGMPHVAVERLHQKYPQVPEARLHADVAATIAGLTEHGWLRPAETGALQPQQLPDVYIAKVPSPAAGEFMRVRESALTADEVAKDERAVAEAAYARMLGLTAPGVAFMELTRSLAEGNAKAMRPASYEEALHALEMARLVTANDAQHRVACYELSLTAALFCGAKGLAVDWCLGVAFAPNKTSYHSWLQAANRPVRGEADEVVTDVHQRVLRVTDVVAQ